MKCRTRSNDQLIKILSVLKTTWACFQICDKIPSNVWKIGGAPLTPFDYNTCYNFIYITYIPYYIPYIVIVTKITTLKFLQPHLTTVLRIRHPHWNIILKVIQLWKKCRKCRILNYKVCVYNNIFFVQNFDCFIHFIIQGCWSESKNWNGFEKIMI